MQKNMLKAPRKYSNKLALHTFAINYNMKHSLLFSVCNSADLKLEQNIIDLSVK
jgi:hypothetical protein